MYITIFRLRRAFAATAVIAAAGIAMAVAGVARADTNGTPDAGVTRTSVAAGAAEAPPGSAGERSRRPVAVEPYEVVAGDSFWAIAEVMPSTIASNV